VSERVQRWHRELKVPLFAFGFDDKNWSVFPSADQTPQGHGIQWRALRWRHQARFSAATAFVQHENAKAELKALMPEDAGFASTLINTTLQVKEGRTIGARPGRPRPRRSPAVPGQDRCRDGDQACPDSRAKNRLAPSDIRGPGRPPRPASNQPPIAPACSDLFYDYTAVASFCAHATYCRPRDRLLRIVVVHHTQGDFKSVASIVPPARIVSWARAPARILSTS
jgi:hypothetical protein